MFLNSYCRTFVRTRETRVYNKQANTLVKDFPQIPAIEAIEPKNTDSNGTLFEKLCE